MYDNASLHIPLTTIKTQINPQKQYEIVILTVKSAFAPPTHEFSECMNNL